MRLAVCPEFVELAFQRYSWVGTLLAAVLGAYLCARIVNTFAATAISPKPGLLQSVATSPRTAQMPTRTELDAERLAKSFDLPLPKPAGETAAEPVAKAWNASPVRSSLRAVLGLARAPGRPHRGTGTLGRRRFGRRGLRERRTCGDGGQEEQGGRSHRVPYSME